MGSLKKQNVPDSSDEFTLEEEALVRQWLEYKKVVLDRLNPQQPVPHSVFQELNNQLKNTSYLAGNKFSKADAELLLGLIESYVSLTPNIDELHLVNILNELEHQKGPQSIQSKEKYPYLSRWFRHVQRVSNVNSSVTIPFSRSSLY